MFDEAWKLCAENDERDKYLMTFQNFLSRVPKWNSTIIGKEYDRIKEASSCNYMEDLIACVHVVQLKSLTCMRVGMKNKTSMFQKPPILFIMRIFTQLVNCTVICIYTKKIQIH
jgi:hypothetical protein